MYEELIKNYTSIILEINDTSQTLVAERLKISQTKLSIALSIIKDIRKHYTLVPKDCKSELTSQTNTSERDIINSKPTNISYANTAKSDITSTNISYHNASETKPNSNDNISSNLEGAKDA